MLQCLDEGRLQHGCTSADVRRDTKYVNNMVMTALVSQCRTWESSRAGTALQGPQSAAPSACCLPDLGSGKAASAQTLFGRGAWPQPARGKTQPQNLTLGAGDAVRSLVYQAEEEPLRLYRYFASRWHLSAHNHAMLGRSGSGTAHNFTHAPRAGSKWAAPVEP